jgi:hypothetical protein
MRRKLNFRSTFDPERILATKVNPEIPLVEINGPSGNEFRAAADARRWLAQIQQSVFGI